MNILTVDRQEMQAQMLKSKLEDYGHRVVIESSREEALTLCRAEYFDLIFVDPAPVKLSRQILLDFRRNSPRYSYVAVLSEEYVNRDEVIKHGANEILSKPVDPEAVRAVMDDAEYLNALIRRIGDDSQDFPNAGGVIAKSAFNQLFLAALERADRYGERSFILFISISNSKNILEMDGGYAAGYAAANLSKTLARLRRQSDIIAQTGKYEYALLLQRPIYEMEPMEATNRFIASISDQKGLASDGSIPLEIDFSLIELPGGKKNYHYLLKSDEAG